MMKVFDGDWREKIWSRLDTKWDIIIIGGGITGAGILKEATNLGYKALLVEQSDFASGTSSRSSKLVHGGFRYLKNLQFKITMDSVGERERLLREGEGLIHPLKFLFINKKGDSIPGYLFGIGLILYGMMAGKWLHKHYSAKEMRGQCAILDIPGLKGGYGYLDAQTDDARLTLRIIREAVQSGGTALNYTRVAKLLKTRNNNVCGVVLEDLSSKNKLSAEVLSKVIINATGPWADELREQINKPERIRPLRGSHLAFSQKDIPLECAVSLLHPEDGRSVFIFPWENLTVVGTTDIDTFGAVPQEPRINQQEADYLFKIVNFAFPNQNLEAKDVVSTWAGIRPVIATGKIDPSKESREHVIWEENGLITVTGGKLTTFRIMALQTLKMVQNLIGSRNPLTKQSSVFEPINKLEIPNLSLIPPDETSRLIGRYGLEANHLINEFSQEDMEKIGETKYIWPEINWAVKYGAVVHLQDLLLRRVRLGILTKDGGSSYFPRIKRIFKFEKGWDDARWENEKENYLNLRKDIYTL